MDTVFGVDSFRNEIIWKRSASHGTATNFHFVHDVLLYYTRSGSFVWNPIRTEYDPAYVRTHYGLRDAGGQYQLVSAHGKGSGPARRFGDREIKPPKGRHWMNQETIDGWMAEGRVVFTKSGMPRYKRYLTDTDGPPATNVWTDIAPINSQADERLGYPTQKPVKLLKRVIIAGSKVGDVVLDPFCGCGTAVIAAQELDRDWIGIDITHLAINVMRRRIRKTFGTSVPFTVIGEPQDLTGAAALASRMPEGRYQFQWWILDRLDGRRRLPEEKKKLNGKTLLEQGIR
jgi:adenine specific DNA methylase Mod